MKRLLLLPLALALTSCYPFYEADSTTWKVGVAGTHQEVADLVTNIVSPNQKTFAK